jgi:chitin synthase
LAEQIKAFLVVLDAFGNAKTQQSPNASRHGRLLELHFNDRGRLDGAKVLAFALDKFRVTRLAYEERTFHVFYQLLAGATPAERDALGLEDMTDYALLASSGCYRLPAGPFADDGVGMADLRAAYRALAFKPKHVAGLTAVLAAVLELGNVSFGDGDYKDASAHVANPLVLDRVAALLGVDPADLATVLTNKTTYVRKELYTVLLDAKGSAAQRDQVTRDLYAILFAFVVEHANARVAPGAQDPPPLAQVALLDLPGFQARASPAQGAPLVSFAGAGRPDELYANIADELVQAHTLAHALGRAGPDALAAADGVERPAVTTMDNTACLEMLRGASLGEKTARKPSGLLGSLNKASAAFKSGKAGDNRDAELVQELAAQFGSHASFATASSGQFGINHYAAPCTYDAADFVERDTDLLDPSFVTLLRTSSDGFIARLLSGPSLSAERHPKDESMIVQAQVSSRPFRQPTPILGPDGSGAAPGEEYAMLDPGKTYPVSTQVHFVTSELLRHLARARLWTVSCIRPNDSGSPNSFDKRRVKAQVRALLLPDLAVARASELALGMPVDAFLDRYVPTMQGESADRLRQVTQANGWIEGRDFALGQTAIWLTYCAWKAVEDPMRAGERARKSTGDTFDDDEPADDARTEYTAPDEASYAAGAPYSAGLEAPENPFLGGRRSESLDARSYALGGMPSPHVGTPAYSDAGDSGWGDKKERALGGAGDGSAAPELSKEADGLVAKAPETVEALPTSRTRRVWVAIVWMMTWWIPSILLHKIGRMKRPDVRLAWREKFAIVFLIFLFNALVIFFIVFFGKLLCPNQDKAWAVGEVGQHTASNDYWVAIQGYVYDVSNFINGDHSDITGQPSNAPDVLSGLAGQDLTEYFPIPLTIGCKNLVTDKSLQLQPLNFNPVTSSAVHTSGPNQPNQGSRLHDDNWYTERYLPKIKQYKKGPLVIDVKAIQSQGQNSTTERFVPLFL